MKLQILNFQKRVKDVSDGSREVVVAGKKGSLTSHESSECPSTTPGPPAALHVTAPTPSDSETGAPGHFLAVYSKIS